MADLDLDINNYNINDIERFLTLDPKNNYTANDVELREYEIREKLLSSGHIDRRLRRDVIEFLSKCKEMILYSKFKKSDFEYKPQTSEPVRLPSSREEYVIKKTDIPFTYSNTSDFFPGTLNPLNTRVISKCVSIDTRFRDNYTRTVASDFTIQLPSKLNKVVSMQLSSIEFPMNFYSISASYGNNYLYLYVNSQSI